MFDHYTSTEVLRDGSAMRLRPILPEDSGKLLDLYTRLSRRSLYYRFLVIPGPDARKADYLARVDYRNSFALVGEVDGKIIAVARYHRLADFPDRAEAAFTIADDYQGQGIGPRLLSAIAGIAREHKITQLEGEVLAENEPMMKVLSQSGFDLKASLVAGLYLVSLSLSQS